MIFLAGSLDMNGGSTFLIRLARESFTAEKKMDVVVLGSAIDPQIESELGLYANIIKLEALVDRRLRWCGTNQAAIFLPMNKARIDKLLEDNDRAVHAMGIFGVIYAYRLARQFGRIKITAGVYHQNEFAFDSSLFFVKRAQKMFASLPSENVVFFNEFNRKTYSGFFKKDYSNAPLLPIGVALPKNLDTLERPVEHGTLVSIGNLVDFKTYNEHVIRVVAELINDYPQLRYAIYGEGDQQEFLESLVAKLNLQNSVTIHKRIPYSEFKACVEKAMGFIGSGTAILEAAALRVPAITGIESIKTPETYGFLSDVVGFSYNEIIDGVPLVPIKEVITRLLKANESEIQHIGQECATKAREFSIEKTLEGFTHLKNSAKFVTIKLSFLFRICFAFSFLYLVLLDVLGINRQFRLRRDQSSTYKPKNSS